MKEFELQQKYGALCKTLDRKCPEFRLGNRDSSKELCGQYKEKVKEELKLSDADLKAEVQNIVLNMIETDVMEEISGLQTRDQKQALDPAKKKQVSGLVTESSERRYSKKLYEDTQFIKDSKRKVMRKFEGLEESDK